MGKRNNSLYTMIDAANASSVATAVDVSRAEAITVQAALSGNSGTAVTIVLEGSIDGSTWATIDSTTKTNSNAGYFVSKALTPYKLVRSSTVSHATQAAVTTQITLLG